MNQNLTTGKYFRELATVTFQDSNIRGNASAIRYGRLAILTLSIAYITDLSLEGNCFFRVSSILSVAATLITGNATLDVVYNGYIITAGVIVIQFAVGTFNASDEIISQYHFIVR